MIVHTAGTSDFDKKIKMLVVGAPGSGKTRFAATFPNPVFANCLGGMMSLADRGTRYVDIHSEADLLELKQHIEAGNLGTVETLVLDTIDEFQRILLAERLISERRPETNASDYGWLGQRMHTIIDGLCGMGINIVILCHTKDVLDGVSGQLFIKPGLQGAFAEQVIQYVDFALMLRGNSFSDGPATFEMGSDEVDLSDYYTYRVLASYPTLMTDWVKDLSGALPPELQLDFESDYLRIAELLQQRRAQVQDSEELVEVLKESAVQLTLDDATDMPISQMTPGQASNEVAALGLTTS